MAEPLELEVLATLRDVLSSDSPLAWRLALLSPTKKLARMLGGVGASLIKTPSSRLGMPHGDLLTYCSREISAAQVTTEGEAPDATPSLSR